jgi:hypothetical protein
MGVISVRFNSEEERILKELSEYYGEDRSKLVKKSIMELYETLNDRKVIDQFEIKESKKKTHFHSSDEMLKLIE